MPSQIATRAAKKIIDASYGLSSKTIIEIIDADLAPVREALEVADGEIDNHPDGHTSQFQRAKAIIQNARRQMEVKNA